MNEIGLSSATTTSSFVLEDHQVLLEPAHDDGAATCNWQLQLPVIVMSIVLASALAYRFKTFCRLLIVYTPGIALLYVMYTVGPQANELCDAPKDHPEDDVFICDTFVWDEPQVALFVGDFLGSYFGSYFQPLLSNMIFLLIFEPVWSLAASPYFPCLFGVFLLTEVLQYWSLGFFCVFRGYTVCFVNENETGNELEIEESPDGVRLRRPNVGLFWHFKCHRRLYKTLSTKYTAYRKDLGEDCTYMLTILPRVVWYIVLFSIWGNPALIEAILVYELWCVLVGCFI